MNLLVLSSLCYESCFAHFETCQVTRQADDFNLLWFTLAHQ